MPETPEERGDRVAKALGNAVVAAAALEKALLGEIYRRQMHDDALLVPALEVFDELPAGRLLGKLREQGLETDLARRLDEVLKRRNRMVHGLLDDIDVARAILTGDGIMIVEARIAELEAECGRLTAELQPLMAADIAEHLGMSLSDAAEALRRADLSLIPDPAQRAELERAQQLIELTDWPNPPLFSL